MERCVPKMAKKMSVVGHEGDFFFFARSVSTFFLRPLSIHSYSCSPHTRLPFVHYPATLLSIHPHTTTIFSLSLSVLETSYTTIPISHNPSTAKPSTLHSQFPTTHASDHPNTPHHTRKQLGLWPGLCGHGSQRLRLTSLPGRGQHALLW